MTADPDEVQATSGGAVPDTSSAARRRLFIGAVVVLVAALVAAFLILGDRDPGSAGGSAPVEGPTEQSAARGPGGTRTFADVPEEIPAGVLTGDAADVEGTVARGGDDWSAALTFVTERDPSDVDAHVTDALRDAGFTARPQNFDGTRLVTAYDGEDGSILTVTITLGDDLVSVAAVRVSP